MEVYICNNRKGGVGKTTLTAFLATMLAAFGFQVAIVDGDSQVNASKLTLPRPYEGEEYALTLTQVVTQGRPLLDAMVQARKNLWVIPADEFLEEASMRIIRLKNPNLIGERVEQLKSQLAVPVPYQERFPWWEKASISLSQFKQETTSDDEYLQKPTSLDFLFFDSPPAEDALTDSMLRASRVLIPINMDQFSIDGLRSRVYYVQNTEGFNGLPLDIAGIIPNEISHKGGSTVPLEFLADVWKNFPGIARRPIHADDVLKDPWAYSMTLLEYGQLYAPRSRGMHELAKLALEIAGWTGRLNGLKYCEYCRKTVASVLDETSQHVEELEVEGE